MDFFHASAVSRPMMNDTTRRQTIEVKSLQSACLFILATQMSILTGLPSKIKCSVGFLFIRNLSSSQRHITWNDKVIINDEAEGIKKSNVTFERVKQAGLVLRQGYFLRKRRVIDHRVPISNCLFPGGHEIDIILYKSNETPT